MSNQTYYENVVEGQEIPPLEKQVTTVNMVMYLATLWFFDRIHFDYLYSTQRRGLPNAIAPGTMGVDYYAQLLSDWAGEKGEVRRLSVQNRHFMVPGDTLTCGGKITGKNVKEGKGYVELELWIKNQDGTNCVPGRGVVELPMRKREKD